jgi:hypothetical protein
MEPKFERIVLRIVLPRPGFELRRKCKMSGRSVYESPSNGILVGYTASGRLELD